MSKGNVESKRAGGRASHSQKELQERRIKEYELWINGISKTEIARQFNLTPAAIILDLKAIAALEPFEDAKERIDGQFKNLIKVMFEKINDVGVPHSARIGYIHELNESLKSLARIHGLDKGDTFNFNQTQIITGVQIYDKWDDNRIQEEFKRRRLEIQSDSQITGEK